MNKPDTQARINRTTYILGNMLFFVFSLLGAILFFVLWYLAESGGLEGELVESVVTLVFYIIYLPLSMLLVVRRFHDLNMSGWHALLLLVPLVNIFFGLILIFQKPDGPNRYGRPYAGFNFGAIVSSDPSEILEEEGRAKKRSPADADELMKFAKMYKAGFLTEEEWAAKKRDLL